MSRGDNVALGAVAFGGNPNCLWLNMNALPCYIVLRGRELDEGRGWYCLGWQGCDGGTKGIASIGIYGSNGGAVEGYFVHGIAVSPLLKSDSEY